MDERSYLRRASYALALSAFLTLVVLPLLDPRGYPAWYWFLVLVPYVMFVPAAYLAWKGRRGGALLGMILAVVTTALMLLDAMALTPLLPAPLEIRSFDLITTVVQVFVFQLCARAYREMAIDRSIAV